MAELFDNFEINRSPRWPRLARTLAGSLAVHLLLVAAVLYVPALQSILRAAGTVAGVEFVDEEYDRTLIGQRATVINVSDHYEKLYYPPGYFSTNDPTAPLAPDAMIVQEAAAQPLPTPVPRPRRRAATPRPQPTPTATPTPEASASPEVAENNSKGAGASDGAAQKSDDAAQKSEEPKTAEDAEKLAAEKGARKFPEINARPFKDLLAKGKEMKEKGDIDLNRTVELTVTAERRPDGTLANASIDDATGDENLKKLAAEFIAAVGDSKVLAVLEGTSHLTMKLTLDKTSLSVRAVAEADSSQRASDIALGYGALLIGARLKKSGTDEAEIWNSVDLNSEGTQVILTFSMTRATAGTLLAKQVTARGDYVSLRARAMWTERVTRRSPAVSNND